jgi:hypothetical protein
VHGRRIGAVATAGLVLLLGPALRTGGPDGAGGFAGAELPERVLVWVSGLDGHLLHAHHTVPLHAAPDGPVIAELATEALVWAEAEAGEWIQITLAGGGSPVGWVAAFFLRGELHLVDPATPGCPVPAGTTPTGPADDHLPASTKVRPLDLTGSGPDARVLVAPLPAGDRRWVARNTLSEIPGPDTRAGAAGTPCEDFAPRVVPPHHGRPDPPLPALTP